MSSFFILGKGHLLSAIARWKVVAFSLISTEAYGKICLASCKRLWFGIYETCWICEDYWNSWDGLNAYCIMRLRLSFPEARGGTLRFKGIPWVRWASGCGEDAMSKLSVRLRRVSLALFYLDCQLDWTSKCLGGKWSTLVCKIISRDNFIKRALT